MNVKSKIALVIATIAFLCLVGWNINAQDSSSGDWEYKIVTVWGHPDAPASNLKQLNDLGNDGWEMVTLETENLTRGTTRQTKRTYYFKRPS